jgi:small subunit ribosomal protein S4
MNNNYPPGEHGPSSHRRLSDYGIQMREKQRIKYTYGILERQFRNYFKKADLKEGITGHILIQMLESRLDNVVYRMGFAPTRRAARQLVTHGHFLVNNRKVNIPSFLLKNDTEIKVREKSKRIPLILDSVKRIKGDHTLPWLSIDKAKLVGVFMRTPERNEVPEEFNEQLVVELYSK